MVFMLMLFFHKCEIHFYVSCPKVTFQYSFWDRFKLISTSNAQSLTNMAKLIAHLFASNALSMSLLKVCFLNKFSDSLKFKSNAGISIFEKLITLLLVQKIFTCVCTVKHINLCDVQIHVILLNEPDLCAS